MANLVSRTANNASPTLKIWKKEHTVLEERRLERIQMRDLGHAI